MSSSVTFSAGTAMAAAASTNPKKRKIADDDEDPTDQEVAAMSRSERKRHREKKRRSDVNKGFDELMALLLEIDPEVRADAEERASKGQCKRSLGAHEENVLSRVDLIATAVRVLRRVNTENVKHKKMIDDFLKTSKGPEASFPRAPASSLGAAPAHHNHLAGLDRASLLQKSAALGLGGAAPSAGSLGLGDPSAQLRAKANLLSSQQSDLGAYSTADLLALRARSGPSAAAAVASRDAALLSQLNANREALQRNLLVQNMLQNQQPGQMSVQGFEALYGPLGGSDAPSQSANSFSITEGLYGALGGGARTSLQAEKEEQLRQLRAAGLS